MKVCKDDLEAALKARGDPLIQINQMLKCSMGDQPWFVMKLLMIIEAQKIYSARYGTTSEIHSEEDPQGNSDVPALAEGEDHDEVSQNEVDDPALSDANQEVEESPGAGSDDQDLTEEHEHDLFPPDEGDQDNSDDSLVDDPEGEEPEAVTNVGGDQDLSDEDEQDEDSLVDYPQPTMSPARTSRYHQPNFSNLPHPELADEAVDVTAKMSVDERKGDGMKDDSEAGAEEDDISIKEAAEGENATNSTATEFVVTKRAMTRPSLVLQVGKTLAYEVVSASYLENDVREMNPKTMVSHALANCDVREMNPKTMVSHALANCDVSDPKIMLGRFSGSRRTPIIPYKARVKKPPDKTLHKHVTNLVVVVAADHQEEHGHEEGGVADDEVHEKALGELHQLGPS